MKTECSLCQPKTYGTLTLTTFQEYWDMLNCVPPRARSGGRFAVGEEMADRWQFGGEFPDETANRPVYACYFAVEGNGYDENDTYVTGYFTLNDFKAVTQAQLRAVTGGYKLGDQVRSIECNWQGRVTGFMAPQSPDDCTMLECHHVCGGQIELDDKRWFDPRDVRMVHA